MKRVLRSGWLTSYLHVLLSVCLCSSALSLGSLAQLSPIPVPRLSSNCPAIPAHVDLAHASPQELHRYLLPARPSGNPQVAAAWLHMMQGIKKRVCVPDLATHPVLNHGRPVSSGPDVNCEAAAPSGTRCSDNWSGYIAGDGTEPGFNDVYGEWNVACVMAANSPPDSAQSSWVGLGGEYPAPYYPDGENLWQVGSVWEPSSGYYLWYEAVDGGIGGDTGTSGEVEIAPTSCGDQIFAEVWFAANDAISNVGFALIDNGVEYRGFAPAGFRSGHLSAEWINERPSCDGVDLYALADFSSTQWTNAYASPNDPTAGYYSLGSLAHTSVWMADFGNAGYPRLAWSDVLGSATGFGTDNFAAYWEANGVSDSACRPL